MVLKFDTLIYINTSRYKSVVRLYLTCTYAAIFVYVNAQICIKFFFSSLRPFSSSIVCGQYIYTYIFTANCNLLTVIVDATHFSLLFFCFWHANNHVIACVCLSLYQHDWYIYNSKTFGFKYVGWFFFSSFVYFWNGSILDFFGSGYKWQNSQPHTKGI